MIWLTILGCASLDEQMSERELTMYHHWAGTTEAIAAARTEDGAGFRSAMRLLEKAGDLPNVAYTGDRVSLIDQARDLRVRDDWPGRRAGLSRLLHFCAGCHQVNDIPAPATRSTGEDALLHAVLWQDVTRWDAACPTVVTAERCAAATSWNDRQALLVAGPAASDAPPAP